jgi:hypothetical protein
MFIYIYICISMHGYLLVQICIYVCVYECVHVYICMHMNAYVHIHMYGFHIFNDDFIISDISYILILHTQTD